MSGACSLRRVLALSLVGFIACGASATFAQDAITGGLLYDKWWVVNGELAPSGDHPLYPPAGQQSGSSTFRCKECHGWDYKGRDGAYGSGSHFTDIIGVFGSTMTTLDMFNIIKNPDGDGTGGTTVNGHDFGAANMMTDTDILDVVEFLQTLVIDTDLYINNGVFMGDEVQGETDYTGMGLCVFCHGADGTDINFAAPEDPEWVGTVAKRNPWEMLHKTRIGQPSAPQMPSWLTNGGSDQGAANIGLYAQNNFPAGPGIPAVSAWGVAVMALMTLTVATLLFQRQRRMG